MEEVGGGGGQRKGGLTIYVMTVTMLIKLTQLQTDCECHVIQNDTVILYGANLLINTQHK